MREKACPHCGGILHRARSLPDHRRLFGLIAAAFDTWPEQHAFRPDDAEHLRAWLTAKAGYRETTAISIPHLATAEARAAFVDAIEAAIRAAGGVAFVVPHRDVVAVIRPKSIAWAKLGQAEFGQIRDAISDVIERELGVSADALLRERANAA